MDEAAHTQKLDGIEEGLGREETIYRARFSEVQEEIRAQVWCVLVRDFFSRFLKGADTVVDVGAGDGNFIRNVTARRRVAVDLSPHVHDLEQSGVEVMQIPASEFAGALGGTADIVFMSNFLEHLPSKRAVLDVFDESRRALKPGGLLLILQPNIRYVGNSYWDYIDHQIALTEVSLTEALEISGFKVLELIPRFLPYTVRSRIGRYCRGGRAAAFVEFYLRFPLLWRFFGQQTFVAARPR